MTKKQVFEILSLINEFYEHFEITQSKIDSWALLLKNADFEVVKENLFKHCRINKFPPKVAELLLEKPKITDRMNAIPNAEETKVYLESLSQKQVSTEEQRNKIEQEKAKIREILGITGETNGNS